MRDFIGALVGVILAFAVYTVLGRVYPALIQLFNVFNLAVIYFAIKKDEVFGACYGAFCGLVQDSFSLGVFGVAGLSKTILGFLAGYISKKMDVVPFLRSFVFIFTLTSLELVLWAILYTFVFSERINTGKGLIFFQPLSTALAGSLLIFFLGKRTRSRQFES